MPSDCKTSDPPRKFLDLRWSWEEYLMLLPSFTPAWVDVCNQSFLLPGSEAIRGARLMYWWSGDLCRAEPSGFFPLIWCRRYLFMRATCLVESHRVTCTELIYLQVVINTGTAKDLCDVLSSHDGLALPTN